MNLGYELGTGVRNMEIKNPKLNDEVVLLLHTQTIYSVTIQLHIPKERFFFVLQVSVEIRTIREIQQLCRTKVHTFNSMQILSMAYIPRQFLCRSKVVINGMSITTDSY